MPALLNGLRVLLLEDEVLIAMDVEQLCLDNGAATVKTVRDLVETEAANPALFDIAIVDLRLGGQSTLGFARRLNEMDIPFIFASGYTDIEEIAQEFPGAIFVPKPYSGNDLIDAVAAASRKRSAA